ncbi:MAG: hypothetical protein ABIP94_06195 [Planctomycetota bacterium]
MANHRVRVRSVTRASAAERQGGLLAYLTIDYGDIALDSVVLRRTLDSRHVLSFPQRRDRAGRVHAYVKPVSEAARVEIERQVFAQVDVELLDTWEPDDA